jgi:hypothetical protein
MGEQSTGQRRWHRSASHRETMKAGRGGAFIVTCAVLVVALAALMICAAPRAVALAMQKTTIGTEIKSISPGENAPKAGKTRLVVLQYAPGTSNMGRPMAFTASNRKTVFIAVTDQFATRIKVSRKAFVKFWREKGRSCEVKWQWRTIADKRVRFIQQISLADVGTA